MCLKEEICVLDEPRSGMSYRAVGCEFNVNDSTVYIKEGVFKTHKTRLYCSVDENVATRGLQEPNPVFPPLTKFRYLLIQCLS